MKHRPQRVAEIMRDQLSLLIARELEFPGALVTITEISVDNDLGGAKVGISVWPAEKKEEVLGLLKEERGRLQHLLIRNLEMQHVPELMFRIDTGPESAAGVEKAFLQMEKEKNDGE